MELVLEELALEELVFEELVLEGEEASIPWLWEEVAEVVPPGVEIFS